MKKVGSFVIRHIKSYFEDARGLTGYKILLFVVFSGIIVSSFLPLKFTSNKLIYKGLMDANPNIGDEVFLQIYKFGFLDCLIMMLTVAAIFYLIHTFAFMFQYPLKSLLRKICKNIYEISKNICGRRKN